MECKLMDKSIEILLMNLVLEKEIFKRHKFEKTLLHASFTWEWAK
jgi:hypothetical protein